MEQQTWWVGEDDLLQEVVFEGEPLGQTEFNDESGTTAQTLYRTEDGRLLIYEERGWRDGWGKWRCLQSLIKVNPAALDLMGAYGWLGQACGFGRALALDEALE